MTLVFLIGGAFPLAMLGMAMADSISRYRARERAGQDMAVVAKACDNCARRGLVRCPP